MRSLGFAADLRRIAAVCACAAPLRGAGFVAGDSEAVLLAARLVDAITDPIIGWSLDRLSGRRRWIAAALPVLGLGILGLLTPPAGAGALWLPLLLMFGLWTLWRAPLAAATAASQQALFAGLAAAFKVRGFAPLLAVFAATGIAAAIPSATVLFFVADVLDAADIAGLFLVLSLVYAALPVLLKLGAVALLWRWRHVLEPAPVAPLVVVGPTNRGACES